MSTSRSSVIIMIFCTVIAASAQLLFKEGSVVSESDPFNGMIWVFVGLLFYALGAVLMIYAFKNGEVTVLYPIVTLSYVWVGLVSYHYFNEPMNLLKWAGIIVIVAGISIIGISSRKAEGAVI